jgi:hypothetical protein
MPTDTSRAGASRRRRGSTINGSFLLPITLTRKPHIIRAAPRTTPINRRAQLEAIASEPGNSDDNREVARHDSALEFPPAEEREL